MKEKKLLKTIECQGTDREIGRQYGEASKEELRGGIEGIYAFSQQYQMGREQVMANARKYLPLVENFDPQVLEFVKGIAEGSGISFEEAVMLQAGLEMMFYAGQISGLCTSFAATGEAAKGGKTFLGQNIDWLENSPMQLLRIKRADGIEQLSLGGQTWGLNSAGIGFCLNATFPPQDTFRLNIPMGCYLSKLMRQRTIADALGVLCQSARGLAYHHLGSSEGDIIGFESTFDDYKVIHPERDMLVHSNHYLTERFKNSDLIQFNPGTFLRVQRIRRLMELNYGQLTPKLMMEFLADHHNYPVFSICCHVDETKPQPHWETVASVIMIPAEGTMLVAAGNPCRYEYVEYKL